MIETLAGVTIAACLILIDALCDADQSAWIPIDRLYWVCPERRPK